MVSVEKLNNGASLAFLISQCGLIIKCLLSPLFHYRNEFKAYSDVKPVKLIKAKSQYQPPNLKTDLQTSYSATYRGCQAKPEVDDNKALDRRRIRTLYHEPYRESSKVQNCFFLCECTWYWTLVIDCRAHHPGWGQETCWKTTETFFVFLSDTFAEKFDVKLAAGLSDLFWESA